MEWGVYANKDALSFKYGDDKWFTEEAVYDRHVTDVAYPCIAKGNILWEIRGDKVKRHDRNVTNHAIHAVSLKHIAASGDALYVCHGVDLWKLTDTYEKVYEYATPPERIYGSEAGILYSNGTGVYTSEHKYLTREIDFYDAHDGIFAASSGRSLRVWYVSSWQCHHRIHVPGKIIDLCVTTPWLCAITDKNNCCVWDAHSGEAYRRWSVRHPLGVSIDRNAHVTVYTRENIRFFEDTGTCVYSAPNNYDGVTSTNDVMWLKKGLDRYKTRPIDMWPLQLAMWCEAPLSVPFPAPPFFVTKSVEDIVQQLEIYWKPLSMRNVCSEKSGVHARDFAQLVPIESWSHDFFTYAAGMPWTRSEVKRAMRHLRAMDIRIDVMTWANVAARVVNDDTIALWDEIVTGPLEEIHVPMILRVCDEKRDDWLLERAEEAATLVAHPYLLTFLPLDTCVVTFDALWDDWVPVLMEWVRRTNTLFSRRMWRIFLRQYIIHGPEKFFCDALEIMDRGHGYHPTRPYMEQEVLVDLEQLAAHPSVLMNLGVPALRPVYGWELTCTCPLYIAVALHDDMFVWSKDSLIRRDLHAETAVVCSSDVPVSVATFDDQVAVAMDDYIDMYRRSFKDMVNRFPYRVLDLVYEDAFRLWTITENGSLTCLHSVHGRPIHEEELCFPNVHTLIFEEKLFMISTDSVCIYNTREKILERNIMTSHVVHVFSLQQTPIYVYEDHSFCLEQTLTPLFTAEFRPLYAREHDEHIILVTSTKFQVLDATWKVREEHVFSYPAVDVCCMDRRWYILHTSGQITALEWSRERVSMVQKACARLEARDVQRYVSKVVNICLLDTTLNEPTVYLTILTKIMEDRMTWVHLLREDVLRWLMELFFQAPKDAWMPLWQLFSFRGTTHCCAICQSCSVSDENPVVILKNCAHRFHQACIDRMVALHGSRNEDLQQEYALTATLTCPVCRSPYEGYVVDTEYTELAGYESE